MFCCSAGCDFIFQNVFFFNFQVHEGEECTRFPLECPQQCGLQDIPREEVQRNQIDTTSVHHSAIYNY